MSSDAMGSEPPKSCALAALDPQLQEAVRRLYWAQQQQRWRRVLLLWLVVVPLSLWGLREPLGLLREYFTWSALRYGLLYHPVSALGLLISLLLTLTSAVARWGFKRWGYRETEVQSLMRQVQHIRAKGERHPLWEQVWGKGS